MNLEQKHIVYRIEYSYGRAEDIAMTIASCEVISGTNIYNRLII